MWDLLVLHMSSENPLRWLGNHASPGLAASSGHRGLNCRAADVKSRVGNEPTDATCCFVLFSFASFVLSVFSAIYSSFPSRLLVLFFRGNFVYSDCHLFSSSNTPFPYFLFTNPSWLVPEVPILGTSLILLLLGRTSPSKQQFPLWRKSAAPRDTISVTKIPSADLVAQRLQVTLAPWMPFGNRLARLKIGWTRWQIPSNRMWSLRTFSFSIHSVVFPANYKGNTSNYQNNSLDSHR